ncbi:putative Averantin oxidoreductase [Glonium stellatum]|uniref:Putative Averantin oxidoreductase n=1 Tax=Glonium stellatum TaxID=574774 RepID=A0A8E2ET45_9PEZI|nr:putative Averantin oxidoreductase [Glonium stellatum]
MIGEYREWVHKLFESVIDGVKVQATRRFAKPGSWLQLFMLSRIKSLGKSLKYHIIHTREKVLRRLDNDQIEHRDFIWYMLRQKEKFDLKQDEIIANSAFFIMAGSETTATVLCGLMARLIWNPTKYSKLVEEIRTAFKHKDEITYQAVTDLEYLNACIEEALRVHPAVPPGLLRTVPDLGDFIDGCWVPGGTTVSVGGWAASHNPDNFRDPEEFIPERWIDDYYANDSKKAMQPFSLGPRGCIGKSLAYMEMRLVMSHLLWNFDIVSVDGAPEWDPVDQTKHMKVFITWEKKAIMVKVIDLRKE